MKTLIAYSSKSGASRACAELLASKMEGASLCDLSKQMPDPEHFDRIILGSGVRIGSIYKPMKQFIQQNLSGILTKKTAIFLCNGEPSAFGQAVEKNIPSALRKHAVCIESFGGIPPFRKPQNSDWILAENVSRLIEAITV